MSKSSEDSRPRRHLLRREPWLTVLLAALVPGVAAMVAPAGMRRILALTVVIMGGISLLLLVMHRPDGTEADRMRKLGSREDRPAA